MDAIGHLPSRPPGWAADTAVDAFPPILDDEVLVDLVRWAPAAQPLNPRPVELVPPQVPEPVGRYTCPGRTVWFQGVEIVPWYGPKSECWLVFVPGCPRLLDADTESALFAKVSDYLARRASR